MHNCMMSPHNLLLGFYSLMQEYHWRQSVIYMLLSFAIPVEPLLYRRVKCVLCWQYLLYVSYLPGFALVHKVIPVKFPFVS